MPSHLATRVRRVQRQLGSGGGCHLCRRRKPIVVRNEDEDGRALPGGSGAPCSACGNLIEIVLCHVSKPLPGPSENDDADHAEPFGVRA